MKTITICSSANFYKQVNEIADELSKNGYTVLVPKTAKIMKQKNNYNVSAYKTWFASPDDYDKKADLMRAHFNEIEKGDAILVVNNTKHGVDNYIGGNVLMEMAIAFHLGKDIFLLNEVPKESAFLEEILGMQPTVLGGDIKKLKL